MDLMVELAALWPDGELLWLQLLLLELQLLQTSSGLTAAEGSDDTARPPTHKAGVLLLPAVICGHGCHLIRGSGNQNPP